MNSETLAKALILTAETLGHELSPMAAEMMARDLAEYPDDDVATALFRCRRELPGRLTLAAIIDRIKQLDGRPGVEAAWAIALRGYDEADSLCWTQEIAQAFGDVRHMEDRVAARMAFKEGYAALCDRSRNERVPGAWSMSFGHDVDRRFSAEREAIAMKRISPGARQAHATIQALPPDGEPEPCPEDLKALLKKFRKPGDDGDDK